MRTRIEKECKRCGELKSLDLFSPHKKCKDGKFPWCKKCKSEYQQEYIRKKLVVNPSYQKHLNKVSSKNYYIRRLKLLEKYGGACQCCGETEPRFLNMDHVNNDGSEDRRKNGRQAERWQSDLQVLCANCNWAKRFGVCPHKKGGAL